LEQINQGTKAIKMMKIRDNETQEQMLSVSMMEDKEELSTEMVANIEAARAEGPRMGACDKVREAKKESWGPTLVERQRRRHDNGIL
jgi:hypothetical protein